LRTLPDSTRLRQQITSPKLHRLTVELTEEITPYDLAKAISGAKS
jgi:hypothetical protein